MATQQTTTAGRLLVAPSVILLFLWMIVPLVMTLYFSTLRYNLLDPDNISFVGLQNYLDFLSDPDFLSAPLSTRSFSSSPCWSSASSAAFWSRC